MCLATLNDKIIPKYYYQLNTTLAWQSELNFKYTQQNKTQKVIYKQILFHRNK